VQLRGIVQPVHPHLSQQRAFGRRGLQLGAGRHQGLVAFATAVLQPEGEAGGVAQFGNRGRVQWQDEGVADLHQRAKGPPDHGLCRMRRALAILPILERDEGQPGVLSTA